MSWNDCSLTDESSDSAPGWSLYYESLGSAGPPARGKSLKNRISLAEERAFLLGLSSSNFWIC